MSNCFNPANILLPNDGIDMEKWSVIACDQFTSQTDYWDAVEKYVGDAPSTLNVVFPEIYLGTIAKQENDCNSSGDGVKNDKETGRKTKYASMTDDERIKYINTTMDTYLTDGTLKQAVADGYVLVERTMESGVRLGIVGLIDLDDYDFDPKKKTLIRATEGTVISRIPPRVKIRENAAIELPHVMLLVDDPIDRQKIDGCQGATQEDAVNIAAVKHGIIEYVYAIRDTLRKLYDTDLMQGGGHIRGYAVEGEAAKQVTEAFAAKQNSCGGFLFAVGDGNHSLATAKTCWENIKKSGKFTEEQLKTHPARHALVEICNLHSEALEFKPIHRVLFGVENARFITELKEELSSQSGKTTVYVGNEKFEIPFPSDAIDGVKAVQAFIDDYLRRNGGEVDYIHGDDELETLCGARGAVGIKLPSIDKTTFFDYIVKNGTLPRKTFSMGEAEEKRYYMEARRIR